MHLAINVRPDIAYVVGMLSRFLACPTTHWQIVKGVLKYLSGIAE